MYQLNVMTPWLQAINHVPRLFWIILCLKPPGVHFLKKCLHHQCGLLPEKSAKSIHHLREFILKQISTLLKKNLRPSEYHMYLNSHLLGVGELLHVFDVSVEHLFLIGVLQPFLLGFPISCQPLSFTPQSSQFFLDLANRRLVYSF